MFSQQPPKRTVIRGPSHSVDMQSGTPPSVRQDTRDKVPALPALTLKGLLPLGGNSQAGCVWMWGPTGLGLNACSVRLTGQQGRVCHCLQVEMGLCFAVDHRPHLSLSCYSFCFLLGPIETHECARSGNTDTPVNDLSVTPPNNPAPPTPDMCIQPPFQNLHLALS